MLILFLQYLSSCSIIKCTLTFMHAVFTISWPCWGMYFGIFMRDTDNHTVISSDCTYKKNSNLSASYSYNIKVYMRLLSPIIFCIMSLNFFLWSYEVVYLRLTALFTQKRCDLIINGFTFYVQFKREFDTSWLFQGVIVPLFLSSVNGNKMFWLQKWNETYKQYLKGI